MINCKAHKCVDKLYKRQLSHYIESAVGAADLNLNGKA